MVRHWIRYETDGQIGFGLLNEGTIRVHDGDMFGDNGPTGQELSIERVRVLAPTAPGKMIALWNNFGALAEKQGLTPPKHPLFLLKAPNSFIGTNETIRGPIGYDGPVVFEGELGIVIGRRCAHADDKSANDAIFGYTCVNDVTAFGVLDEDASFAQWTRAKSFDTFGVFGPVIAQGLDPANLVVRTILDDSERQNYPTSDMLIPPAAVVQALSHDMTLEPGDVVACGTSVGVGRMKPGNVVRVEIDGIGALVNRFELASIPSASATRAKSG